MFLVPMNTAVGASALMKASWRLVPLIGAAYGSAYMDRVNISFAQVQMNQDLHFSSAVYGLGAGLFFVSYALCEIPSNLLLVRFGARRWLARIMLTWGLLAMGMMFVKTANEFYLMRFLLGVAEAGFFPGVIFYLTEWFPPEYRARTISRFYVSLPLSSTVMGSLAGWLLALDGRLGLHGWQWLFAVEGVPPLLLAVLFWRYLPDAPRDAAWLLDDERSWLEARQVEARAGKKQSGHAGISLRLALLDPGTALLGMLFLCQLTVFYAWTFSAPKILMDLTGWSVGRAGWALAGMGLLGAAAMILNAVHSDRQGERTWHVAVPMLAMGAAYAAGGLTRQPLFGMAAFAVAVMAFSAAQAPLLSLPSRFLAGQTYAVGYAAINTVGICGGFLGPVWMNGARALLGSFRWGLVSLALPSLVAAGLVLRLAGMRRASPIART